MGKFMKFIAVGFIFVCNQVTAQANSSILVVCDQGIARVDPRTAQTPPDQAQLPLDQQGAHGESPPQGWLLDHPQQKKIHHKHPVETHKE